MSHGHGPLSEPTAAARTGRWNRSSCFEADASPPESVRPSRVGSRRSVQDQVDEDQPNTMDSINKRHPCAPKHVFKGHQATLHWLLQQRINTAPSSIDDLRK